MHTKTAVYPRRFAGVLLLVGVVLVGALMDGSRPASANPLTGVSDVAVGGLHSCALTTAGSVKCWGDNRSGQLGDGTALRSSVPVAVVSLISGVEAIAIGVTHTCALTITGGVKCWGGNFFGELGNGTTVDSSTPVDVVGLTSGVVAIGAGESHSCAVTSAGSVKCWGDNRSGQLGDGTFVGSLTPVAVTGISAAVAVESGFGHSCAVTATGGLLCWGVNFSGQLGDGTTASAGTPVGVSGLAVGAAAVAVGFNHSCALTRTGGVQCWGDNSSGQLGDGTAIPHFTPADVLGLTTGVSAIATGLVSSCAIDAAGAVQCWAFPTGATPAVIEGLESGAIGVALKFSHACALTSSGGVKCWGSNGLGQLGDGTEISRVTPVDVVELTVKPTPTSTPCPGVCPTPTDTPGAEQAQMSVSCDTDSQVLVDCQYGEQQAFTVAIHAVSAPAAGYVAFQAKLSWDPAVVDYRPAALSDEIVWPSCSIPARIDNRPDDTSVLMGCVTFPAEESDYTGALLQLEFACIATGTSQLTLVARAGDPQGGSHFIVLDENDAQIITDPTLTGATVTCASPVGGISLDSDMRPLPLEATDPKSSAWGIALVSGLAFLLAMGSMAWYGKRWSPR